MKELINLKGVKTLSKMQQRGINGGRIRCLNLNTCNSSCSHECVKVFCGNGDIISYACANENVNT